MFWNIEYKGKLKGDIEQISSGRPLSEGSVMFKEPDSITKVFVQGALFAIPIVALMIIFACFRIGAVYGKPTNMRFMDFMVPFAISNAIAVKVGFANGAENYEDLKKYVLTSHCICP